MKKTILYPFLTILVIGYSEDSAAYFSPLVSLDATPMRAYYRALEEHGKLEGDDSTSSSRPSQVEIDAAIKGLYEKSVFHLPVPSEMASYFNPHRRHFKPGSSPAEGSFEQQHSGPLLTENEFWRVFTDSDTDSNMANMRAERLLDNTASTFENMERKLKEYIDLMLGIHRTAHSYSSSDKIYVLLKGKLEQIFGKNCIGQHTNLTTWRTALEQYQASPEQAQLRTDAMRCIEEIEATQQLIQETLDQEYRVFEGKASLLVAEEQKELGELSDADSGQEILSRKCSEEIINNIKTLLPRLRKFVQQYCGKNTKLIQIQDQITEIRSDISKRLNNRLVYQQKDPRLGFILFYGSQDDSQGAFDLQTAVAALQDQSRIFVKLRDRKERNQFRIDCGYSWKDLVDVLKYDCFVARNKGNMLLKDFLAAVLLDIYDDDEHEVWVTAKTEDEAECANEDAKRLAFLVAEGAILKMQPQFRFPNQAKQTFGQWAAAIQKVTIEMLQHVDRVDYTVHHNVMLQLFGANLDTLQQTVTSIIGTCDGEEYDTSFANKPFAMPKITQQEGGEIIGEYDCGVPQRKVYNHGVLQKEHTRSVTYCCCLNSSLNIYCSGNWVDGLFYLQRLAQGGILNPYFASLRGTLSSGGEYELTDRKIWYRKIVSDDSGSLQFSMVSPVLRLVFGVNTFVNNKVRTATYQPAEDYASSTIYGPTLAITGDGHHFQALRLYPELDKAAGEGMDHYLAIGRSVGTFDSSKPTYIEAMYRGLELRQPQALPGGSGSIFGEKEDEGRVQEEGDEGGEGEVRLSDGDKLCAKLVHDTVGWSPAVEWSIPMPEGGLRLLPPMPESLLTEGASSSAAAAAAAAAAVPPLLPPNSPKADSKKNEPDSPVIGRTLSSADAEVTAVPSILPTEIDQPALLSTEIDRTTLKAELKQIDEEEARLASLADGLFDDDSDKTAGKEKAAEELEAITLQLEELEKRREDIMQMMMKPVALEILEEEPELAPDALDTFGEDSDQG